MWKKRKPKIHKTTLLVCLFAVLALLALSLIIFNAYISRRADSETPSLAYYQKHYVFISDKKNTGELWESIYNGAKTAGEDCDSCVEWFGSNLVEDYSKRDLMRMAIAAKVDGIIVDGDDSDEMNDLINEAVNKEIPVIAVMKDCYGSYRNSFVGMSAFNLGQEYGELVLKSEEEGMKSILVIINTSEDDGSEKLTYAGIREVLENRSSDNIEVSTIIVNNDVSYESEEAIRDLLLDKEQIPDIIVCLDEQTTEKVIQSVVDYNRVGEAKILGFYDSQSILEAIDRNIIDASVTIDTDQIGRQSVQALHDYYETGYVSDYIPAKTQIITKDNVKNYLEKAKTDE